jgi:hypothetical protein
MKTVPTARARAHAFAIAALGLGLAGAPFVSQAGRGDTSCPDSPTRLPDDPQAARHELLDAYRAFDALLPPGTLPRQLLPGTRRPTPGVAMAGHLAGTTVLTDSTDFSFLTKDGHVVSGTVDTEIVDADCKCDFYWRIHVLADSWLGVDQVILKNFEHPAHQLYAAWRDDDTPLGIPPDHAQRSPDPGTTIVFRIGMVVQPGQESRALLLDSQAGFAQKTATIQLRATDGSLSPPIATWAPEWGPHGR